MGAQQLDLYIVAFSVLLTAMLAGVSLLNMTPDTGRRITTIDVLEYTGIAAVLYPTVAFNLYAVVWFLGGQAS